MSSTSAEDVSAALEPKLEDSGDYKGLQDIDMDKPVLDDDEASQEDEDDKEGAEDISQADEEMEDLFGDDREVDEVKHEE